MKSSKALTIADNNRQPAIKVQKTEDGKLRTDENFGLEAIKDGRQGMFSIIIPKGAEVPAVRTRVYYPIEDFQSIVKVRCFKGDHPVADHNIALGEFLITGIEPKEKKRSKGIQITYTLNREGVVLVDAIELDNPTNHLKVRLEYHAPQRLLKSVAKGVLKEMVGFFLPSGKQG